MASVLFMDIVSYSLGSIDDQSELLTILQTIVRQTSQFQEARSNDALISLPTGDGMALVFLRDPVSPVQCALEVAAALRDHPELHLRMGIHSGPISRHADIKEEINVVGGGINIAQRVMDCGDAGHILLSRAIAEVLEQLRGWNACLQDLGVQEVKHGVRVQLYNLCKDGLGNPAVPRKIGARQSTPTTHGKTATRRTLILALATVLTLLAAGAFLFYLKPDYFRAAAPLAAPRTMRYYAIVQKYRGGKPYEQPFHSTGQRIFEADYRIWLVFTGEQPGYLYLLNEGPTSTADNPAFNILFPAEDGSARLNGSQELKIPQGGPFVFDRIKGVEKLWVVWAKNSQPELEALKKWANHETHGAIGDRSGLAVIQSFLAKYKSSTPTVVQDDANQSSILKGGGDVWVHLLKLEHD